MSDIFRFLRPNAKYFDPYFKKDEKGKEIYYPWGYAGESYYVSERQKDKLKNSFIPFGLLCLICILFFLITNSSLPIYSMIIITAHVSALAQNAFLYFHIRNLEPYKSQNPHYDKGLPKPKLFKDLISSFVFFLSLVFLGLSTVPNDQSLALCGLFLMAFYPISIWLVWYRKGYIFQEKPLLV